VVHVNKEILDRPLRVASLIATRNGDVERGPMVMMNPADATGRLLNDGELAWVYGPRRHELATVRIDPDARVGDVVLRDIVGAAPSEIVRVVKPDLDTRGRRPTALA
jgi:anaerobic selenocysteine-containing dehydrogenase